MAKRPKLVTQYLEKIHRDAFEEHPDLVRELVRGRNGIYALYRKDELYYVGLATDLRFRVKAHLKDRHATSWDRFSVYLTIGDKHLRELESLAIRITRAEGNRQNGSFAGAENLSKSFARSLRQKNQKKTAYLMGRSIAEKDEPPAKGKTTLIKGIYKKKTYWARMRSDGGVRFNKILYSSLSAAATAVRKSPTNGRWFWRHERSPGDWVRLNDGE